MTGQPYDSDGTYENASVYHDALFDMVWQFAYRANGLDGQPPSLYTGGLSALEEAFDVLGWEDPKPFPNHSCDAEDCQRWPSSGTPLPDGDYLTLCYDHYKQLPNVTKKAGRGYDGEEREARRERRSYA